MPIKIRQQQKNKNMGPLGAAAVDFGLNTASGLISMIGAKKRWRMQNEYNHPKAQMQRLKEAGINPHALVGSSGMSGAAAPVPSWEAGTSSRYQDARVKGAQTDLVQKQNDILTQQLRRETITSDILETQHKFMLENAGDQKVASYDPTTNKIEWETRPGKLNRYQVETRDAWASRMTENEVKQLQGLISKELSWSQALTNLGMSEQKLKMLKNNTRLWDTIDSLVDESVNPKDMMAMIMKILLSSAGVGKID